MGRVRAAIRADWELDALSRSRWSAAHALKEIEEAEAEAAGKRKYREPGTSSRPAQIPT